MPLPQGLDSAYAYCVMWVAVEVLLLAILAQMTNPSELIERTRVRTFRRLLPLNEHLSKLVDAWDSEDDLVPDNEALVRLKRIVDRAAAVSTRLQRRTAAIELGRLSAILQVLAAFLAAALIALGLDRQAILTGSLVLFSIGTAAVVLALVIAALLGMRIAAGDDFP